MEIRIRPAAPSDLPALADLARRTWSDAFGPSVSPEDLTAELERTRSESYFVDALRRDTILLAESDQAILGYVQFGDVNISGLEPLPEDRELHRLYVETALQGRSPEGGPDEPLSRSQRVSARQLDGVSPVAASRRSPHRFSRPSAHQ